MQKQQHGCERLACGVVVPAESKKVAFELMAAPPRPLTVRVLDGAGRVRATLDKAREGHIVNIDREPTVEKGYVRVRYNVERLLF